MEHNSPEDLLARAIAAYTLRYGQRAISQEVWEHAKQLYLAAVTLDAERPNSPKRRARPHFVRDETHALEAPGRP